MLTCWFVVMWCCALLSSGIQSSANKLRQQVDPVVSNVSGSIAKQVRPAYTSQVPENARKAIGVVGKAGKAVLTIGNAIFKIFVFLVKSLVKLMTFTYNVVTGKQSIIPQLGGPSLPKRAPKTAKPGRIASNTWLFASAAEACPWRCYLFVLPHTFSAHGHLHSPYVLPWVCQ